LEHNTELQEYFNTANGFSKGVLPRISGSESNESIYTSQLQPSGIELQNISNRLISAFSEFLLQELNPKMAIKVKMYRFILMFILKQAENINPRNRAYNERYLTL